MGTDDKKTIDGNPVVWEAPGSGTGDTVYKTADGRLWETIRPPISIHTGDTISTVRQESR